MCTQRQDQGTVYQQIIVITDRYWQDHDVLQMSK